VFGGLPFFTEIIKQCNGHNQLCTQEPFLKVGYAYKVGFFALSQPIDSGER
jgi:hypothetical protein